MKQETKKRSKFEIVRSLMQKSIRRGNGDLSLECAEYLYSNDNYKWLYSRFIIIAAEECWHYIGTLPIDYTSTDIISNVPRISSTVKDKSAAGLGGLALELSQNSTSLPRHLKSNYHVRLVAEAIRRPKDYWKWAESYSKNDHSHKTIRICKRIYSLGGWPWDMAFLISASYLSLESKSLGLDFSSSKIDVPLWSAVDKHTSYGKLALRRVAHRHNISYDALSVISFYLESAVVNDEINSEWWAVERHYALSKIFHSLESAQLLWDSVRSDVEREIFKEVGDDINFAFSSKVSQIKML